MNRRIHTLADDDDTDDVVKGNPGLWGAAGPARARASSVFAAGEQAAPRARPAKVTAMVVKGGPLPPKARSNAFIDVYGDLVRQLRQLKPDEHLELPHARAKVLQRKARAAGVTAAVRKVDALLSGVWKL